MKKASVTLLIILGLSSFGLGITNALSKNDNVSPPHKPDKEKQDAVQDAQTVQTPSNSAREQKKNEHDRSEVFLPSKTVPITQDLNQQIDKGKATGFDFLARSVQCPETQANVRRGDEEGCCGTG